MRLSFVMVASNAINLPGLLLVRESRALPYFRGESGVQLESSYMYKMRALGKSNKKKKSKRSKKGKSGKSGKDSKSGKSAKSNGGTNNNGQEPGGGNPNPNPNPVGPAGFCDEIRVVTNHTAKYNSLILDSFQSSHVTFSVSPTSRVTVFDLTIPTVELNEMQSILASFPATPLDASDTLNKKLVVPAEMGKDDSCEEPTRLHVTIPKTVSNLCIGGECRPVLCPLSANAFDPASFDDVSFAPSNSRLLFGNSTNCTIIKPPLWDEWVLANYGTNDVPEDFYFSDTDGDGLSNIIEYYGLALESIFDTSDSPGNNSTRRRLVPIFPFEGTDPNSPDSDGDLLTDKYEWMFGLDPNVANDISLDSDGDSLTDFDEQKYPSNPLSPDSDGDGVPDNEEVENGSSPMNDQSNSDGAILSMQVTLSVGDPSGSHSERYTMLVGDAVEHQAPQFGVVSTSTYTFQPGVYDVRIRHRDSNLNTPDYDYYASIDPDDSSSDLVAAISDPQGILGSHYESSYDYAAGKSATLTISCPDDSGQPENTECCYSTCADCNTDENCEWNKEQKSCQVYDGWIDYFKDSVDDCACAQCETWAAQELNDRDWINALPQCPCTVTYGFATVSAVSYPDAEVDWDTDLACNPLTDCEFHPEARGCIRADGQNDTRQQCCYYANGNHMPNGEPGAGTPDRDSGLWDHIAADVTPYNNCCKYCEDPSMCSKYIGSGGTGGTPGARSDIRECI